MNKLLEMYNLLRWNQKENLKNTFTTNEMKAVINNLPTNKSPGPDGFIVEFYQISKKLTSQTISKNSRGQKTHQLIS